MGQGIKCLRQMAMREIIYGHSQTPLDPDEVLMQQPLLEKLIQCAPTYAHTLER